jgi:hypothetical protein
MTETNTSADEYITAEMVFGSVRLDSWLQPRSDGALVGMGRVRHYDGDGRLVRESVKPTGLVAELR